ncbi:hypothetical protein HN031_03075 [Nocardioides sp. zg-1308]|uniref:glycosyltransferase n=1 Tax=Nocardioides sp. zg-1308 TaxID=2736253 RepID=UPI001555D8F5|nr:hypothetical protein [Nocardioides sp. zg-1308]
MGLTIACVFNDIEVRRHCLDRSLDAYRGPVEVEYLPVDNTDHAFSSAGAALNHAVRRAHHDVVVMVHQDVYLHDVDRLAAAAAALEDPRWGILGASGVTSGRQWAGRLRDRVILIGEPAPAPVEVDTLDEVLVMARRDDLLAEPLSEDPELAWHAYAVEYALRVRSSGRAAGAVDTAITHNSLTTNLARLAEAHRHVADHYPALVPIHTTCGTVDARDPSWRRLPIVQQHGWRRRWLRQSPAAARVRAALGVPVVLADIAHEVDLVDWSSETPLTLVNLDRAGGFAGPGGRPLLLERAGRPLVMSAVPDLAALRSTLAGLSPAAPVLVTGLKIADLAPLSDLVGGDRWLAGVQWDEVWLLGGPAALDPPVEWSRPQAVPLTVGRPRVRVG